MDNKKNCLYLDGIILEVNKNFDSIIEHENNKKRILLYEIFDKLFIVYLRMIDKEKIRKPVEINFFEKFYYFKKVYGNKYNIVSFYKEYDEDLIVYSRREDVYIRWEEKVNKEEQNERNKINKIYQEYKKKKISEDEYLGEQSLFFMELFMKGKVYKNLFEILEDINERRGITLKKFLLGNEKSK